MDTRKNVVKLRFDEDAFWEGAIQFHEINGIIASCVAMNMATSVFFQQDTSISKKIMDAHQICGYPIVIDDDLGFGELEWRK